MFELNCKRCGTLYESGSNRQGYCPECKKVRQRERNQAYLERRNSGEVRAIGSTATCEKCGNPFIIKTGSQKLCQDCIDKGINLRKTTANNKYRDANYDAVQILLPKGERENLKSFAALHGKSMNEFVLEAVAKYRKELEEASLF